MRCNWYQMTKGNICNVPTYHPVDARQKLGIKSGFSTRLITDRKAINDVKGNLKLLHFTDFVAISGTGKKISSPPRHRKSRMIESSSIVGKNNENEIYFGQVNL